MKLSIIVPIFNLENFIERCINSLMNQNIDKSNYEVIVINDGSIDHSLEVINKLANIHSNIRVLNQENKGLSGARNNAINAAIGEYIWFVDGDDRIKPNCLLELTNTCAKNLLDILVFERIDCTIDGEKKRSRGSKNENKIILGKQFLREHPTGHSACFAIYKRDFILTYKLLFNEFIIHEDFEFNIRAFFLAQKFIYTSEAFYYYDKTRDNSICNSINVKSPLSLLKIQETINSFVTEKSLVKDDKKLYGKISAVALNISILYSYRINVTDLPNYLIELKKRKILISHNLLFSNDFRYFIESIVLIVSPKLFRVLINFVMKII